jgi:RimJ/RimL family protein N-acetyltransferase
MNPVTVAETSRLRLRHFTDDDAAFIVELLNDPDWIRFIGDRNIRSLDDARRYLRNGPIASYRNYGYGLYAVELKARHDAPRVEPLGMCGLVRRPTLDDADIGFAFLPAWRGRGYASEAAAAVLAEAMDVHGLSRVVAIADPENHASITVLRRAGMSFERLVRLGDDPTDLALYTMDTRPARS